MLRAGLRGGLLTVKGVLLIDGIGDTMAPLFAVD